MVREKETLEEALKYAQLTRRPKVYDEESDKTWLKALVRCAKVDGTFAYAIGEANYKGEVNIIKTFGTASQIIKTLEIYPFEYLKKMYQAKFLKGKDGWDEKMDYINRIKCPDGYLPTPITLKNMDEVMWMVAKYRQEHDIREY